MTKPKLTPRPTRARRPGQVFTCGPFQFQVSKALALAAGAKYRAERRWPSPEWVGPFLDIKADYIEQADLTKPVVFATLVTEGRPWRVLIDGNHRVLKALRHGVSVDAIELDLADTLKIVRGPAAAVERLRREGAALDLL